MAARTDAPQNIRELQAWALKHGGGLEEWYLRQIDRRWRSLGKQVNQTAGLFEVRNYN